MNMNAVRRAVRLYVLADTGLVPGDRLGEVIAAAIRGGATMVQLRAKSATTLEQIRLARKLLTLCRGAGVPLIVNDRVDVALAAGADGVHVGHIGVEDIEPQDARRLMGGSAIVGVSVASGAEAREAQARGASYVSAGPIYATGTKANAGPAAGEALLRAVRAATDLPLVAIGGITADRAPRCLAAGADGVCVGAAILLAPDAEAAARAFVTRVAQQPA